MSFPVQEALFERGPGDGSTVAFQFSKFSVDVPSEVGAAVINRDTGVRTDLSYPTDYLVGLDSLGHGTVTFVTAPAYEEDYFLYSNIPYSSLITLGVRGFFDEIAIVNAINRTAKQLQQMSNAIDRNIQTPQDASVSAQLVAAELLPGYALVVSEDGTRITTTPIETGTIQAIAAAVDADRVAAEAAAADSQAQATLAGQSADAADASRVLAEAAQEAAEVAAGSVPTMASILSATYPVGTIYSNETDSRNPATIFGFTSTWVALEGVVVVGYKSGDANFGTPGANVGVASVTLTAAQSGLPAHTHTVWWASSGGSSGVNVLGDPDPNNSTLSYQATTANTAISASEAHPNIQPSRVAYVWKRTA